MFYDKYIALCAQKGVTPSAAAKEIGINKAAVSNWKYRKNGPSDVTMQKIADYFGVPVSNGNLNYNQKGEHRKWYPPLFYSALILRITPLYTLGFATCRVSIRSSMMWKTSS